MPVDNNQINNPLEESKQDLFFEEPSVEIPTPGQLMQGFQNQYKASTPGAPSELGTAFSETRRFDSFNPLADNEEVTAEQQSSWAAAGKGLLKFAAFTAGSFASNVMGTFDMFRGATGGNVYKNEISQWIDNGLQDLDEYLLPNYRSQWSREHPFLRAVPFSGDSANFWFDGVLKNTGFMVGTVAGALATDTAAAFLTRGMSLPTSVTARLGQASLYLARLAHRGDKAADIAKLADKARTLGTAEDTISAFTKLRHLAEGKKVLNMGRQASINVLAAHTEAAMEAREGYNSLREELVNEYIQANGYTPDEETLAEIDRIATAAGNTRYGANMALLMASNALLLGKLLRPIKQIKKDFNSGVLIGKGTDKRTITTAKDKVGKVGDIDDLTVVKPGRLDKLLMRSKAIGRGMLTEGVWEEGGQFLAGSSIEDYFRNKYHAEDMQEVGSVLDSFTKGLGETFGTNEGLESMFIGSIIGGFTPSVVSSVQKRIQGSNYLSTDARLNKVMESLSQKSITGFIDDKIKDGASALKRNRDVESALENGDLFALAKLKEQEFFQFAMSRVRVGRADIGLMQLDMLNELPEEEAMELFGLDDSQKHLIPQIVESLKSKLLEVKDLHESMENTFENPFTYHKEGNNLTKEQQEENKAYRTYEGYRETLTETLFSINTDKKIIDDSTFNLSKITNAAIEHIEPFASREGWISLISEFEEKTEELEKDLKDESSLLDDTRKQIRSALKEYYSLVEFIKTNILDAESTEVYKFHALINQILGLRANNNEFQFFKNGRVKPFSKSVEIGKIVELLEEAENIVSAKSSIRNSEHIFGLLASENGYEEFQKAHDAYLEKLIQEGILEDDTVDSYQDEDGNVYTSGQKYILPEGEDIYTISRRKIPSSTTLMGSEVPVEEEEWLVHGPEGIVGHYPTERAAQTEINVLMNSMQHMGEVTIQSIRGDGTIIALDSKGKVHRLKPSFFKKYQYQKNERELIAEKLKKNPKNTTQISEIGETIEIDENPEMEVHEEDRDEDSPHRRKEIGHLYTSTTYSEKNSGHLPEVKRLKNFIDNYLAFEIPGAKAILVTKNNEKALGLEGLTDLAMRGNAYNMADVDNAPIYQVYVVEYDDQYYFIGEKGERLGKVNEPVDINKVVFGAMPTTSLNWRMEGEGKGLPRYYISPKGAPKNPEFIQKNYRAARERILSLTDSTLYFDILAFPGVLKTSTELTPISKGPAPTTERPNPLPFVSEAALDKSGTIEVVLADDARSIKRKGAAYVKVHGRTVKVVPRKFKEKEAITLFNALRVLAKNLDDGKKFDSSIFNYLKSVLYITTPKKVGPSSLSITQEGIIHLGDKLDIPLTEKALMANRKAIIEFFKDRYVNISGPTLKLDTPYTEIININDNLEIETFSWKSYQHFLGSATYISSERSNSALHGKSRGHDNVILLSYVNGEESFLYHKYITLLNTVGGNPEPLFKVREGTSPVQSGGTPTQSGVVYDGETINTVETPFGKINFTISPEGVVDGKHIRKEIQIGVADKETEEALPHAFNAILREKGDLNYTPTMSEVLERLYAELVSVLDGPKKEAPSASTPSTSTLTGVPSIVYDGKTLNSIDTPLGPLEFTISPKGISEGKHISTEIQLSPGQKTNEAAVRALLLIQEEKGDPNYAPSEIEELEKKILSVLASHLDSLLTPPQPEVSPETRGKASQAPTTTQEEKIDEELKESSEASDRFLGVTEETTLDIDSEFYPEIEDSEDSEEFFRVAIPDEQVIPHNKETLAEAERRVAEMVDFPIRIVRKLIRATDGGYAYGMFRDDVIYLYENAEVGTEYHEAFEGVWARYLTPKERKALIKEFRNREGTFFDRESQTNIEYKEASEHQAKERMAEEFRDYGLSGTMPVKPSRKGNLIYKFFQDLIAIARKLLGISNREIADLYSSIMNGEYKGAPVVDNYRDPLGTYRRAHLPGLDPGTHHAVIQGLYLLTASRLFGSSADDVLKFDRTGFRERKDTLYEQVKSDFFNRLYSEKSGIIKKYEKIDDFEYKNLANKYKLLAKTVSDNWDSVIEELEEYLDNFGIVRGKSTMEVEEAVKSTLIVEDGEIVEAQYEDTITLKEEEESKTKDEAIIVPAFSVDFSKKASPSMKLLLSTIPMATRKFIEKESRFQVTPTLDPRTGLPQGIDYMEVYTRLIYLFKDKNTIEDKRNALLEARKTEPYLTYLYKRLGFHKDNKDVTPGEWQLRVEFQALFSKQMPNAYIQYNNKGRVHTSIVNADAVELMRSWMDNIRLGKPKLFKKDVVTGAYIINTELISEYPEYDPNRTDFSKGELKLAYDLFELLGIVINKNTKKKFSEEDKNKLVILSGNIAWALRNNNKEIYELTPSNLNISGYLQEIAKILEKADGSLDTLMFLDINGETRYKAENHNYYSTLINDFNISKTRDELIERRPELDSVYRRGSELISLGGIWFDNNGRKRPDVSLSLGYIQGTIELDAAGKKTVVKLDELSLGDRTLLEINQNVNNRFYINIPADSSTQWLVTLPSFIPFTLGMHKLGKIPGGYFFENFYNLEKTMHEGDSSYNGVLYPTFEDKSTGKFNTDLFLRTVRKQVENKLKILSNSKHITPSGKTTKSGAFLFEFPGLDSEFVAVNDLKELDADTLRDILFYHILTSSRADIEFTRLFFGDVIGKGVNLSKRSKSFGSPISKVLVDPDYNRKLDAIYNLKYNLKPGDPGYVNFSNNINFVVTSDVRLGSEEIIQDEYIPEEAREAYKETVANDAQAMAPLSHYKELRLKGELWTERQEAQYQYMMALDRYLIDKDSKSGVIPKELRWTYGDNETLRKADLELISKGNPHSATFSPYKPIVRGVDNNGETLLHKYSIAPMSYSLYRQELFGKPILSNGALQYLKAVYDGVHYIIAESGSKLVNEDVENYYTEDGEVSFAWSSKNVIKSVNFDYFGNQTEKDHNHTTSSLGVQQAAMISQNLRDNGVPIDVDFSVQEWNGLTEEERKEESPLYTLISENTEALNALIWSAYDKLLNDLGITDLEQEMSQETSKLKVIALLNETFNKRVTSNNTRGSFSKIGENEQFQTPLETTNSYGEVRSILFQLVSKYIVHQKIHGGAFTLVSPVGFELYGHKLKREVNKKGKVYYTSEALKFYKAKRDEKGNVLEVGRAEVMLPNYIGKLLRKVGINKTDQELISMLNETEEGKEILKVFGFRIPTQDTQSMEALVIKGFLPEEFGNTVVVPPGLVTKTGADFDIDALYTYLRNVYIDDKDRVRLIPYDVKDLDKIQLHPKLKGRSGFSKSDLIRKSLENRYIKSNEDLLLHPQNFLRLVSPLNINTLEEAYRILAEAHPERFSVKETSNLLDRVSMTRLRHLYLSALRGIEIGASSQKNNAHYQGASVTLNLAKIRESRSLPQREQDLLLLPIGLAHNTIEVEGIPSPTFSGLTDSSGMPISQGISEYLSGGVDIANNPVLAYIVRYPQTLGIFLTMERMGINIIDTALFMNQPIIIEYLEKITDAKSLTLSDPSILSQVRNSYPVRLEDYHETMNAPLTQEELLNNIKDFAKNGRISPNNIATQRYVLDLFLKFDYLQRKLLQRLAYYNWDTAKEFTIESKIRKDEQLRRINDNEVLTSPEVVLENNYLGTIRDASRKASEAIDKAFFIVSPTKYKPVYQVIRDIMDLVVDIPGFTNKERIRLDKNVMASLLDYLSFKYHERLGPSAIDNLIIDRMRSVASRLYEMKIDNKLPEAVSSNKAFRLLYARTDTDINGAKGVYMRGTVMDAFSTDSLVRDMYALKNNALTRDLYFDLLALNFLQNGTKHHMSSFARIIPWEDHAQFLQGVINSEIISNEDFAGFVDEFFRNNWNNPTLVPRLLERYDRDTGEAIGYIYPEWWQELLTTAGKGPKALPLLALSDPKDHKNAPYILYSSYGSFQQSLDPLAKPTKRLFRYIGTKKGLGTKKEFRYYYPVNTRGDGVRAPEYYGSEVHFPMSKYFPYIDVMPVKDEIPFKAVQLALENSDPAFIAEAVKSMEYAGVDRIPADLEDSQVLATDSGIVYINPHITQYAFYDGRRFAFTAGRRKNGEGIIITLNRDENYRTYVLEHSEYSKLSDPVMDKDVYNKILNNIVEVLNRTTRFEYLDEITAKKEFAAKQTEFLEHFKAPKKNYSNKLPESLKISSNISANFTILDGVTIPYRAEINSNGKYIVQIMTGMNHVLEKVMESNPSLKTFAEATLYVEQEIEKVLNNRSLASFSMHVDFVLEETRKHIIGKDVSNIYANPTFIFEKKFLDLVHSKYPEYGIYKNVREAMIEMGFSSGQGGLRIDRVERRAIVDAINEKLSQYAVLAYPGMEREALNTVITIPEGLLESVIADHPDLYIKAVDDLLKLGFVFTDTILNQYNTLKDAEAKKKAEKPTPATIKVEPSKDTKVSVTPPQSSADSTKPTGTDTSQTLTEEQQLEAVINGMDSELEKAVKFFKENGLPPSEIPLTLENFFPDERVMSLLQEEYIHLYEKAYRKLASYGIPLPVNFENDLIILKNSIIDKNVHRVLQEQFERNIKEGIDVSNIEADILALFPEGPVRDLLRESPARIKLFNEFLEKHGYKKKEKKEASKDPYPELKGNPSGIIMDKFNESALRTLIEETYDVLKETEYYFPFQGAIAEYLGENDGKAVNVIDMLNDILHPETVERLKGIPSALPVLVDAISEEVDIPVRAPESKPTAVIKPLDLEPGRYVKYKDEVWIVLKEMTENTNLIQIYNPTDKTSPTRVVKKETLIPLEHKGVMVNLFNNEYLVTVRGNIVNITGKFKSGDILPEELKSMILQAAKDQKIKDMKPSLSQEQDAARKALDCKNKNQ